MKSRSIGDGKIANFAVGHKSLVLICSSLRAGGAERNVINLADVWLKSGFDVYILTIGGVADDVYKVPSGVKRIALDLAVESTGIKSSFCFNYRRIREIRRNLMAIKPSHAICFNTTTNILTILAATRLNCRVVVSERNYPPRTVSGKLWRFLRRFTYRFADTVVAQTYQSKDWLLKNTFAQNVVVIPNFITWPLSASHSGTSIYPDQFLGAESKMILAVGNLQYQKGHDILISSIAKLAENKEFNNWHLFIVGAGDPSSLKLQVEKLRIGSKVTMVGPVSNVMDWYERADLFVLSSRFEGFPNVLLEAMCSGCCTVSFACPSGPEDIITHKHDGLLVESISVNALCETMRMIVKDSNYRSRLGENAISIREKYSPSVIMRLWASVLEASSANK